MKKTGHFLPNFFLFLLFVFFLPSLGLAQLHVTWSDLSPSYCNKPNGHATAHVRGGKPPYRFTLAWAGIYNSTDSVFATLYQQYNTIEIKDSEGKMVEDSSNTLYINPYKGPKLKVYILKQPSTTCSEDGLVKIDASLSDFGYAYWHEQNGGKSTLHQGIAGGNYYILKDLPWGKFHFAGLDLETGCSSIDTFSLAPVDPKGFNVQTVMMDTLLCRKSIRIVPNTYGFPPYVFDWVNTGETKDAIAVIEPAQYTCKITDATGCTILGGGTTKKPTDSLTVQLKATLPTCTEKGAIAADVKIGIAPYKYEWRTNNPFPDTSKVISKNDTAKVGIGNYRLIIKDAWGCQATLDTTLFANCPNYVAGHIYQDLINKCKYDEGEPAIPSNIWISYLVDNTYPHKEIEAKVDKNGYFKAHLPLGSYYISAYPINRVVSWARCPDTGYYSVKILNEGDFAAHLDFAFRDPNLILSNATDPILLSSVTLAPNPANTQVTVQFFLEHDAPVSVQLLNVTGAVVTTLQVKTILASGEQSLSLPLPAELSDGLYFCRIETDRGVVLKKLLVMHF